MPAPEVLDEWAVVVQAGQSLTADQEEQKKKKDEEEKTEQEKNKEEEGQGWTVVEEAKDEEDKEEAKENEESLSEMRQYIHERHVSWISWHITLNNHASTRPDAHGGKIVESVTNCKTTRMLAPEKWRCVIAMPHSFRPGDGWKLDTVGEGKTAKEADEAACEAAVALLLIRNHSQVVLRPKHWTVTPEDLVRDMPAPKGKSGDVRQALPVHVRAKSEHAGDVGAAMAPGDRDAAVEKVLRDVLTSHGGTVNPARIQHRRLIEHGLAAPGTAKAFETLDRLLPPEGLRPWIRLHPAFVYKDVDGGMQISWAPGHAPAFGSAAP